MSDPALDMAYMFARLHFALECVCGDIYLYRIGQITLEKLWESQQEGLRVLGEVSDGPAPIAAANEATQC